MLSQIAQSHSLAPQVSHVYYINLLNMTDRRRFMERQLGEHLRPQDWSRWAAHRHRGGACTNITTKFGYGHKYTLFGNWPPRCAGILGLRESNVGLLKSVLARRRRHTRARKRERAFLVLEDDVKLSPSFSLHKINLLILALPADWHTLRLDCWANEIAGPSPTFYLTGLPFPSHALCHAQASPLPR